jgi:predicted nuclease with TOPRIM domain
MIKKKITFWIRQLIQLKKERIEEINREYGTTKWADGVINNLENEIYELEEIIRKEKREENSLNDSWKEYNQLYDNLRKYSNRTIESDEEWEIAIKIINDIQIKFIHEIAPALNYINAKYSFCTRAAEDYNQWVETLKKAGLTQREQKEHVDQIDDTSGPEVKTVVKA